MASVAERAYAEYKRLKAEFDAVGIPWNQKGSPHRLLIAAKRELAKVGFSELIGWTIRDRMPALVANITANNALLSSLVERRLAR